jgi:mannosylglycoprotein endo-beta-mannosidase
MYSGLQNMPASQLATIAKQASRGKIKVDLANPANAPVAFFNRLSLINAQTGQRLLPAFYSDNYISVLPGEHKTIFIDYDASQYAEMPMLSISGWNLAEQKLEIKSGK